MYWMKLRPLVVVLFYESCVCFESPFTDKETSPKYWTRKAHETLRLSLQKLSLNTKPAKNVVLFIGDGMDIATMTAGRILKGQRQGFSGEETVTSIDQFPYVGLSKVYTINAQTPDSAGTGTAILTGVKTKSKLLGLSGEAVPNDCSSAKGKELKTILEEFIDAGRSTGIVTTTHVTHATPASAYAHTPSRIWYSDSDMPPEAKAAGCKDIAVQLIEKGRKINVILGGGRTYMRPSDFIDEEYNKTYPGGRSDGRDLIEEWKNQEPSGRARYVWNYKDFKKARPHYVDYLLGLFEPDNMRYEHYRERDKAGEPSLSEMTARAIQILRTNEKGYFLLVEGGKIDHAHHATQANLALSEFLEMEKAVQVAMRQTSTNDTLIVVTGDHGHVFTMGGYGVRGNPVHGLAQDHNSPVPAADGLNYTMIAYGNGNEWLGEGGNKRLPLSKEMTKNMAFNYPTAIPLPFETHSVTDVAVMASGPMAHLFGGVYEQNYIGYAMMYASCVGPNRDRHCFNGQEYKIFDCDGYSKEDSKLPWVKKSVISSLKHDSINNPLPWWCINEKNEWLRTAGNVTEHAENEKDIPNRRPTEIFLVDPTTSQTIAEINTKKPNQVISTKRPMYKFRLSTKPKKFRKKNASTRPRKGVRSTTKPHRNGVKSMSSRTRKISTAVYSSHRILKRELTTPNTTESSRVTDGHTTKNKVYFRPLKTKNQSTVTRSTLQSNTIAKSATYSDSPLSTTILTKSTTEATAYSTEAPEAIVIATTISKTLTSGNLNMGPETKVSSTEATIGATDPSKSITTHASKISTPLHARGSTKPKVVSTTGQYTRLIGTKQGRFSRVANGNNPPSKTNRDNNPNPGHPKERLLDQLAAVIREQLQYLTVSSSSARPTNLTLAIQIAPVMNNKPEKGGPSDNQTHNEGVITCMEWESENSAVALSPGSEKIQQFTFNTMECNLEPGELSKAEKRTSEIAAAGSRGNNTGALVFLALLAVSFVLISAVLFYMLRKKNQQLREEIESREREKKSAAISARLQLEDLDTEECYQGYSGGHHTNYNNNNQLQRRENSLDNTRWHAVSRNDTIPSIITTRGKVFPIYETSLQP